ncbi:MAG: FUSC family protein [Actinomycetota bacterium]
MSRPPLSRDELRRALKMAIASSIAWVLGTLLGEPEPIFAALVPMVAIKDDPYSGLNISADRVVGVLAGVGLGVLALQISTPTIALAVAVIVVGLSLGAVIRVRGEINVQVAISAMIMLLVSTQATSVGITRIWETLLGVGVTLVASALLWPPDPLRSLLLAEGKARATLAVDLATTVTLLRTPGDFDANLERLREHSDAVVALASDLERAKRGLRFNLFHHSEVSQVDRLAPRINAVVRSERHVRSLSRVLSDLAAEGRNPAPRGSLAEIEEATAHIGNLLRGIGDGPVAEIAAATSALDRIGAEPNDAVAVLCQAELRRLVADLGQLMAPPEPALA